MDDKLKKEYMGLQKKYNLPKFSLLDSDFEISKADGPLLKESIKLISETLKDSLDAIQSILSPDSSSIVSLHECRTFDDEEKRKLYSLFKKTIILIRKANIASIDYDEKKAASFISESYKEWQAIKKELVNTYKKLIDSWEKENDIKEQLGYLG